MWMGEMGTCVSFGDQRSLDPLELELQAVMNWHVGARN